VYFSELDNFTDTDKIFIIMKWPSLNLIDPVCVTSSKEAKAIKIMAKLQTFLQ
jgi:hypothetical protein